MSDFQPNELFGCQTSEVRQPDRKPWQLTARAVIPMWHVAEKECVASKQREQEYPYRRAKLPTKKHEGDREATVAPD